MTNINSKMIVMKTVVTLLLVTVAASIVLDSNQYFDRIVTNFGQEVTFYGVGLNGSGIQSYNKKIVNFICECKNIFRIIPSCLTAFAEKLDNNSILCSYSKQPIFQLPTIRKVKGKAFAFYKEPENGWLTNVFGKWSWLQDNGIFYVHEGANDISEAYGLCYGNYPNGYILRLKTTEDVTRFRNSVLAIYAKNDNWNPFAIDLVRESNGQLVWRDGTKLSQTVAAGFTKSYDYGNSDLAIIVANNQAISIVSLFSKVEIICEVNPYQH